MTQHRFTGLAIAVFIGCQSFAVCHFLEASQPSQEISLVIFAVKGVNAYPNAFDSNNLAASTLFTLDSSGFQAHPFSPSQPYYPLSSADMRLIAETGNDAIFNLYAQAFANAIIPNYLVDKTVSPNLCELLPRLMDYYGSFGIGHFSLYARNLSACEDSYDTGSGGGAGGGFYSYEGFSYSYPLVGIASSRALGQSTTTSTPASTVTSPSLPGSNPELPVIQVPELSTWKLLGVFLSLAALFSNKEDIKISCII